MGWSQEKRLTLDELAQVREGVKSASHAETFHRKVGKRYTPPPGVQNPIFEPTGNRSTRVTSIP